MCLLTSHQVDDHLACTIYSLEISDSLISEIRVIILSCSNPTCSQSVSLEDCRLFKTCKSHSLISWICNQISRTSIWKSVFNAEEVCMVIIWNLLWGIWDSNEVDASKLSAQSYPNEYSGIPSFNVQIFTSSYLSVDKYFIYLIRRCIWDIVPTQDQVQIIIVYTLSILKEVYIPIF